MGEFKIKKRKKITKRHLRSACAIILAGALLVTSVQNGFVDRTVKADVKKRTEVSVETKKAVELTVVKEIKSERTENSNTYLMSDGSKKLEVYCEDIRYKDSGKWEDYDTSLTDITKSERKELKEATDNASAYRYVNAQGNTKQYFADVIDQENPIIMTNGDYKIEYAPVIEAEKNNNNITNTESVSLEQIGGESPSQISYQKGGGSVRYDYQSLTNGVKESIILEEKPDSNEFIFDLDLSGMEAKANKNTNEIDLMDKETKDRVAVIAAPNIIDDTGIPTYDYVEYELNSREADNYQLKVVVDTDYLEKASYPLIIDPTYMWITESMIDYRATMSVGGAASSVIARTDSALLMNGTDNQARIYMKFKELNEQVKGKYVYECYMNMYAKTVSGTPTIGISEVLADWDSSTLKWNNQPDVAEAKYDIQSEFVADECNTYRLTEWAKKIASGEINNDYGLAMECVGERTNAFLWVYSFISSEKRPYLYLYYKDVEEVNAAYDGSFDIGVSTEDGKVSLEWDSYSDNIDEYDIYVRKDSDFYYFGKTLECRYQIDASRLGEKNDIRVIAINKNGKSSFFSADDYLSNIISIEKETVDADVSLNQVTQDTDGDGLEDGYEIWDFKTKWNEKDSGGKYIVDSDGDGFPDSYEVFTLGTDPAVANETGKDSDGDGLTDLEEYHKGTDPWLRDSDFDNTSDRSDTTPRKTNDYTRQTVAAATEVHVGLYDRQYSETEDGVTYSYITNIYRGDVKKIVNDYGDTSLNKTMKYFYDADGNNTTIIEQYDEEYDPRHTQTICITYTYDAKDNVTFICDQWTKFTMAYNNNDDMISLKVGSQELIGYANTELTNNAGEDSDTSDLSIGAVIDSNENITTYGNG